VPGLSLHTGVARVLSGDPPPRRILLAVPLELCKQQRLRRR